MEVAMAEQEQAKQLSGGVISAGVCSLLALAVFLFTSSPDVQSRWLDYHRAYHNASAAVFVAGVLWLILALLKAKTNFFEVDRKIASDELKVSMALLVIAVAVVLYLALSHLPSLTPPPEVQMDPVERAKLIKMDRGLNVLVCSVISIMGLLIASLPLRRYFRK